MIQGIFVWQIFIHFYLKPVQGLHKIRIDVQLILPASSIKIKPPIAFITLFSAYLISVEATTTIII